MIAVLETLDDIDWGRLRHAYGGAADVPDRIRALRSTDPQVREKTLHALYGNIFHQGTRYQASAYAVPFLLELLAAPDTPERSEISQLLVALAIGYDETYLPGPLLIQPTREAPESEEKRVVLAAYDAVRLGVPLYRELLRDGDDLTRVWAAYALGWFPEEASGSVPALAAACADANRDVAATALVATGLLGADPGDLNTSDPLLRWGAAIAAACVRRESASQSVVDDLLRWTVGEHQVETEVPYLAGDLGGYASLALRQFGPRHADAAFDSLLTRIPQVSGLAAMPPVEAALRMVFPAGCPAGTAYADLDDRQQRLVRTLAGSPSTWLWGDSPFGNFSGMVGDWGLPNSSAAMRAYCG